MTTEFQERGTIQLGEGQYREIHKWATDAGLTPDTLVRLLLRPILKGLQERRPLAELESSSEPPKLEFPPKLELVKPLDAPTETIDKPRRHLKLVESPKAPH